MKGKNFEEIIKKNDVGAYCNKLNEKNIDNVS